MSLNRAQMMAQRDKKVQNVFLDYAPVWLIKDEYRSRKDSFFFNIVYCNPVHSWINGHYQYDVFNDNLYQLGETRVAEQLLLEIQEQTPYLSGSGMGSIPTNPGNRL
jgi:hypothetical protein